MPTVFDPSNPPILDNEQYMLVVITYTNSIFGFLLNVFYLFVLLYHWKQTLKATNLIVSLNLSCADTVFYTLQMVLRYPLLLHHRFKKDTADPMLEGYVTYLNGCYVLYSLVLMSFERYTIIVRSKPTSIRRLLLFMSVCMLMAMGTAALPILIIEDPYLLSDSGLYFSIHLGSSNAQEYTVSVLAVLIQGIALNLIVTCYLSIVKKVRRELFNPAKHASLTLMPRRNAGISRSRDFDPSSSSQSNSASVETGAASVENATSVTPLPSAASKRHKDLEIQIVRKAMAISAAHLLCWAPYISYCLLNVFRVQNLRTLDYFCTVGVELSSSVNASFSLLMDPKIKKFVSNIFARVKSKIKR